MFVTILLQITIVEIIDFQILSQISNDEKNALR